jgi:hypothetical protein
VAEWEPRLHGKGACSLFVTFFPALANKGWMSEFIDMKKLVAITAFCAAFSAFAGPVDKNAGACGCEMGAASG